MSSSFTCVLIGRGPQLIACADILRKRSHRVVHVVSDCPDVASWAQRHGVARTDPAEDYAAALGREAFDYLFSIVNHAVTPASVLGLPRLGAINYHDSLLPAYSGFHATSWSILDGRVEHGVTWHRMTTAVDAGPYLLQKSFAVTDQDTAFTVAARAGELAVRSFGELLQGLEDGSVSESPGLPARQFRRKSERPGWVVLDWTQSSDDLLRVVRAFDFGGEDNWLTRAKLQTPSGAFLCVGAAVAASAGVAASQAVPGTILRSSADGITVQVASGALLCSGLSTLEGDEVFEQQLADYGVVVGATMPAAPAALVAAATSLDGDVTKSERFWVQRLRALSVPQLHELKAHAPAGATGSAEVALPAGLLQLSGEAQRAMLVAGLAVYAARLNEEATRIDIPVCVAALAPDLAQLYSTTVPLSFAVDAAATWQTVLHDASTELQTAAARSTFARDVWPRYAALRGKAAADRQMAIALAFDGSYAELPVGVRLLLRVVPGSGKLEVRFDRHAISALHAERLAVRLVHLMQTALERPDAAVGTLPIVPQAEQDLLLQAFQDTHRDHVEVACIHELFAAQVGRTPDQTALVCRDDRLTYRELDERSSALARHLQELGVGPDRLVGIAIERSLDMVVGLLAILKAGGAYVPLDPAYPAERLAMMLEDSGARWLLTQRHLQTQLPKHGAKVVLVDEPLPADRAASASGVTPANLAYVIFTSGSTGRPKGVMVEHRNVANFFAGMDERVGAEPGIWLAVTSISFDISVLEIFWTLCRGFETVIQEEGDTASLRKSQSQTVASNRPMGFGLFYFAADSSHTATTNAYRLMLDGARFADSHDFVAVWTPERHFHAFGGLYPNPAVTSAAIAAITSKVELRAGSVVIPLHDPIRVAEEWAVVDNLSQGRVGLSFASGWHANDFVLKPDNFQRRHQVMQESIDTVLRLWAGEKIKLKNGAGEEIEVSVLPRPIRSRPPMWIASAGNIETFRIAGRSGYNVLTNMLGQDLKDLQSKFAAYREARREAGHDGDGIISVMLHTFVTDDDDKAKQLARGPFSNYLTTSYDLVKVAPWMFPAFKQPSVAGAVGATAQAFDPERFDDDDMAALLDHAFDRYFDTAGLFGTPERALKLVEQLKDIGATEVACLIDFGIDPDTVLANLEHLDRLRRLANPGAAPAAKQSNPVSIGEQFARRKITHFQCTPSLARILIADGTLGSMQSLRRFLVGGEALTSDLAQKITTALPQVDLVNMYGPTETTVWSTTAAVDRNHTNGITIGKPIANTQIRILDAQLQLLPLGTPGELCIGGHGVVRGYLDRPELTAERFVADPFQPGNRLYRTGDLARFGDDGTLEYLGRLDQQVKVNGYRIELGEIETLLQRHATVQQAVVAVKEVNGQPQLVGYVLPAGANAASVQGSVDGQSEGSASETADWQSRWDSAYATRSGASDAPARFNTSGWLSTYTGEAIATATMREWLEQTIASIRELKPKRVLEIGCGTGMILYSCLEHVEHYTAVDVSPVALESIRNELTDAERQKVTLLNRAADQLDAVADSSCDLVIINSVAQYFPSADYLTNVLAQAARVLVAGGAVFVGDVRCLELADVFHTLVELHKAPGQTPAASLAKRIAERVTLDTELLLAGQFFAQVSAAVPRLRLQSLQNKRGAMASEMRDFRYDVVLRADAAQPTLDLSLTLDISEVARVEGANSTAPIAQALVSEPALLLVTGAKDARLDRALVAAQAIVRGDASATAESLCAGLAQPALGIDPDEVRSLHADYEVEVRFAQQPGTFDALLRHKTKAPAGVWLPSRLASETATAPAALANTPHKPLPADNTAATLRAHLQEFLPEYMVPQAFVVIAALPLTPNGKIDRKALPDPVAKRLDHKQDYVVPGNDLERTIAGIWQDVLGVERVGRKDNIFDLGASSLLTVEANSQLQSALGQKIPLVTMFRYPTIESLAAHLGKPDEATETVAKERQERMSSAAERRRQARAKNSRS